MKILKRIMCVLLINVMFFVSVAFLFTVKEAKNVLIGDKEDSQRSIEYIMSRDSWDAVEDMGAPAGLYCDKQPYINGEINQEYVNELIATYIDVSGVFFNGAIYVMAEDDQGVIAKPENKIYFECYPEDDQAHYFRILDFDKLFTEEELKDMKTFFSGVNVESHNFIECIGVMDDKYIYPSYIGVGNFNDVFWHKEQEEMADLVITNQDYTGPSDKSYKVALYKINKEYEYTNSDELIDVTTYNSDVDGINKVYIYGAANGLNEYRNLEFIDEKQVELFGEAEENIYKHKNKLDENGAYENDNIFKYVKIFSRQREVDGHRITEYISYVSTPFNTAIDNCIYGGDYNYIIMCMGILNVIVFIVLCKIRKRRNAYEEKARELFFNITDKLAESVDKIKKINSEIVSGEDKSKREVLDKEIKNLVGYIKDVLEWSKADAEVLEIYPGEIELSYMVEAVIKDVSRNSNIKISTDMDMDAIVDIDLTRVAKAVAAFIRDVISKTDVSEKVSVQVKQNDGKVFFKVTNSENFTKLEHKDDSELISKFDVRLGISYVKLHGGRYWYSNEDGKVAHTFEIPVKYESVNAKKKDGKVKDIYGVIAHEIKTPLNVIKLYNEALMDGDISGEKEKKYNAVIDTQVEIISNQIHEVASASHLKTGNLKGVKEKVDIAVLVKDMVARYNVLLEDKQLNVTIDGDENVVAFVDYTGVKSIVSNYIINAVKYSDNGSTINITLVKDNRYVTIKVANDIPQNLRYNTYDKKQGVVNQIERDGLGLIIARTYLDICKAKYGCNQKDETVEYWLKFRLN